MTASTRRKYCSTQKVGRLPLCVYIYVSDKVILFLTDGKPTGTHQNIMQTIYDHNSRLNFSVVIMAYGMHSK